MVGNEATLLSRVDSAPEQTGNALLQTPSGAKADEPCARGPGKSDLTISDRSMPLGDRIRRIRDALEVKPTMRDCRSSRKSPESRRRVRGALLSPRPFTTEVLTAKLKEVTRH